VALFRRGEELQVIHKAHRAGTHCPDAPGRRHCPDCAEFAEVSRTLEWQVLRLPPWHVSVFDGRLDAGGPAPFWMKSQCAFATWEQARRLRAGLREAAAEQAKADTALVEGVVRR
jgi:hypothetical protein